MATTPALGLNLPTVGASRDVWGTLLNENFSTLDQLVSMGTPIGAILDFAGPTPPPGWLSCDGRLLSRVTYAALFAVLGGYWGNGDGSTTFALPNLTGRASVGPGTVTDYKGQSYTFAWTGQYGLMWDQIQQAHLPNYALTVTADGWHNHGAATGAAGAHGHITDAQGQHFHGGQTTTESVAHTHVGTTDVQGDHNHTYTNLFVAGAFTAGSGGFPAYGNGTTSVNGAHQHNLSMGTESAFHTHAISMDGNHAHNVTVVGDHSHVINWDGNHTHTVNLGGSGYPFALLQPTIVVTKIIYAGAQAVTRVGAEAAPTIEGRDELAVIREELAALKAILAPARSPRLLSAPARGMH